MKAVVQRVSSASVTVDGDVAGSIGPGLMVLVGVAERDTDADATAIARKIAGLRVLPDGEGRMNLSVADAGGEVLVVSQFTLLGDVRRGRRPSFATAASSELARRLVDRVTTLLSAHGVPVAEGRFGEMMSVQLVNEGPVTILIETEGGSVV